MQLHSGKKQRIQYWKCIAIYAKKGKTDAIFKEKSQKRKNVFFCRMAPEKGIAYTE